MTIERKRMQQLHGDEADIIQLAHGEFAITDDTEKVFIGINNKNTELVNSENLLEVTTQVINAKAYFTPAEYGAKGDGVTDDTIAFNAMFADALRNATDAGLDYGQKRVNNIVFDLSGKEYFITEDIELGNNIGYYKIMNGTINFIPTIVRPYDASDFSTYKNMNSAFRVTASSGVTDRITFESITFLGGYCGIYFELALNCLISKCSFLHCAIGVQVNTDIQSHEIIVSQCEFRGKDGDRGLVAYIFRDDCHFLDNIVENYHFGGIIKGFNNIITGNHWWRVDRYATLVKTGSLNNIIEGNYFDNCSLGLEDGGLNTTVSNNLFFGNTWYAQIYLLPTTTGTQYELNCYGNMCATTGGYAPELNISNLTLSAGGILTSSTSVFTPKMVGAFIVDLGKYTGGEYTNVAYITEVISDKQIKIKAVKRTAPVAGFTDTSLTYNINIKPTDVMLFGGFEVNQPSRGRLIVDNTKVGSCELTTVGGYDVAKSNTDRSITFDTRLNTHIINMVKNNVKAEYMNVAQINSAKGTSLNANSTISSIVNSLAAGEKLSNFYVTNSSAYPSAYGKLTTNAKDDGMTIYYQAVSTDDKLYRAVYPNMLIANLSNVTWTLL